MPPTLTCPHCSTALAREAMACPGCGAIKKMAGGASKSNTKLVNVTMIIGGILGASAGFAFKWFVFPRGAGLGDYLDAIVLGVALGGIAGKFLINGSDEPAPAMAVWEKPKSWRDS